MTNVQIDTFRQFRPCFLIDPVAIAEGRDVVAEALLFARENLAHGPSLIHSTTSPQEVSRAQRQLGQARAAETIEDSLSTIAEGLVGLGCRQLIVAGGETSGAVVRKLGITTAHVGKEVSPGVPWLKTETDPELSILLKSGNLGMPGLFLDARDAESTRALLLANHGPIISAPSLAQAVDAVEEVEETARVFFLLKATRRDLFNPPRWPDSPQAALGTGTSP